MSRISQHQESRGSCVTDKTLKVFDFVEDIPQMLGGRIKSPFISFPTKDPSGDKDDQPPVFYLAIGHQSEDLKHLIPRLGPPGLQGQHTSSVKYTNQKQRLLIYSTCKRSYGFLLIRSSEFGLRTQHVCTEHRLWYRVCQSEIPWPKAEVIIVEVI